MLLSKLTSIAAEAPPPPELINVSLPISILKSEAIKSSLALYILSSLIIKSFIKYELSIIYSLLVPPSTLIVLPFKLILLPTIKLSCLLDFNFSIAFWTVLVLFPKEELLSS